MDSPFTPRLSIIDLPHEILVQILLDNLDKSSLNAVVRTCRRLHDIGILILWRHISYKATYRNTAQYYSFREELARDPEKGKLVRTLRVDSSEAMIRYRWQIWDPYFLTACPNIEELTLCGNPDEAFYGDPALRFIQALRDLGAILLRSLDGSEATHLRSCRSSSSVRL
jgi:hypothetical protein